MNNNELKNLNNNLKECFLSAGERAMHLRNIGLKTEVKNDNTPVTNGDLEVNEILTNKIKQLTPNIPIVSEESNLNKNSNELTEFWLIDPIDGTHDYINNRDEFTLNAALILNKRPELGIIYAPAKKRLFYSYAPGHCYEYSNNVEIKINCEKKTKDNEILAVSYSDNLKPQILDIHKKLKVTNYKKMKSSFKFCVIASGEYDLYVAEPRASEWDIAAGHAILKNAGGVITDFDGNEILYGKKDFKNPSLILKRSKNL
tara:strand:+ start:727 stop:1500 length:774 start_codon:yes stop_codon:yes gene_type:complete